MVVAMINETAPALADLHEGRERLWDLLDEWMTLDETHATWEEVEALYHAIVAFWRAAPDDAEAWYDAWRAACPAASLRPAPPSSFTTGLTGQGTVGTL